MQSEQFPDHLALPCNNTYTPASPDSFPGLIALGPSINERDILKLCCATNAITDLRATDGSPCLSVAECRVQHCGDGVKDPALACVYRMRRDWNIKGEFSCHNGVSGAASTRYGGGWKLWFVVLMTIAAGILGTDAY